MVKYFVPDIGSKWELHPKNTTVGGSSHIFTCALTGIHARITPALTNEAWSNSGANTKFDGSPLSTPIVGNTPPHNFLATLRFRTCFHAPFLFLHLSTCILCKTASVHYNIIPFCHYITSTLEPSTLVHRIRFLGEVTLTYRASTLSHTIYICIGLPLQRRF